jgi:xylitol oxidase
MSAVRNWAGNITFAAQALAYPQSLPEVQSIIRAARKVSVLGSGHSFNHIADSDDTLVSLQRLPRRVEINAKALSVTIDGGATYADIAPALHAAGFALANVASLPSITVAGAVATATHGSGDGNQNLSSAVSAFRLVLASGEIASFRRGDSDFEGAVVNLGALGVMSELTLGIHPTYDIRQNVYLDLPVSAAIENFDALMKRAYSVSLFTRWRGDLVDQIWIKDHAEAADPVAEILEARSATGPCHPIPGLDGSTCTEQMGIPGPWHERLFHFAIGNTASAGAEIQSEFFVARRDASAAFAALHAAQDRFSSALLVSEVRSVAADQLWLSSAYRQDTIGFHFTWRPEWAATIAAVEVVEAALEPFAPRPHWAKVSTLAPAKVQERFPKLQDFRNLAHRLDPAEKFRNRFVTDLLF